MALGIFSNRMGAICDEMGAVLQRAAFSPNIKDRLDFSCAVFDARGELVAQAAHIPVHLGSMAYAMASIVSGCDWQSGDVVVVNDPYLGGTHLPDVTVISPVFFSGQLYAFVANRAHHANIGAKSPGSMPLSTSLEEEGEIIPPSYLYRGGVKQEAVWQRLSFATTSGSSSGAGGASQESGDFSAQVSANNVGLERLGALIEKMQGDTEADFASAVAALNAYGERLARHAYQALPDGEYRYVDTMDDDGAGHHDVVIAATVTIAGSDICVDFKGTAPQVSGNINCPLSVAAAAVFYVFRCLLPEHVPSCAGIFRPITLWADSGSLVNAERPAAVVAGNVETSTRIVDTVLGALSAAVPELIPAASHGSMNNVAMGASGGEGKPQRWNYYETIGGGMGGNALNRGLDAVQTHMTNTLNTPVESLEMHYPLRLRQYAIRKDSGGRGLHRGGHGLIREFEFLQQAEVTLLTERRSRAPWGLMGGEAGKAGANSLNGVQLAAKVQLQVNAGDLLRIETPGGGAWGQNQQES